MARVRMITRTMEVKDVNVMTVKVSTASVSNHVYQLVNIPDGQELEEVKKNETADVKIVAVVGIAKREVLYGMSEADFMKYATVLPSRSKEEQ